MTSDSLRWRVFSRWTSAALSLVLLAPLSATSSLGAQQSGKVMAAPSTPLPIPDMSATYSIAAPSPDPRVGLKPGDYDPATKKILTPAAEAIWNLKMVSHTPPSPASDGATHSDLAFKGKYVLQGNYNGFEVWDISNPAAPVLTVGYTCPASQDDISVYGNLLFVSAEATNSRLDCGTGGAPGTINLDRIRGVRIFDISDIAHPKVLTEVQTCRGSHTHTLLTDPNDKANVYIYVSGTSQIRAPQELAACTSNPLDPNTSLFNIEIIKVPLAHPEQAAVVSHARIFSNDKTQASLVPARGHGASPMDTAGGGRGGRGGGRGAGRGGGGGAAALSSLYVRPGPDGKPPFVTEITPDLTAASTSADSARFRKSADSLRAAGWTEVPAAGGGFGGRGGGRGGRGGRGGAAAPVDSLVLKGRAAMALIKPLQDVPGDTARYVKTTDSLRAMGLDIPFLPAPRGALTQCHDITVYPAVGYAGGACAGMGLLLDIHDPANPKRIDAVSDTNFSYWHSATFSNDGTKLLFSDEWGGGSAAYCRSGDPMNWGGDAMFNIVSGKLQFKGYYKMPAPQTAAENCVAHNGSLIPIPGRDILVQSWYQGGISIFEWTDPTHPKEIAFFDRGPLYVPANDRPSDAGFWSSYWYNGYIVGSEIARGMDVFELQPSQFISQNEIDAAKLVKYEWLNVQDQPKFVWPADISVVRSYLDQLVRWNGIAPARSTAISSELDAAMKASGAARKTALTKAATEMDTDAKTAKDGARVKAMAAATRDLANATK
ncbi:MAG TPA: hypothetical protein VMH39_04865 [Gemmatimonadaceae bacterium]|nr:hypothetical protein [Gemmatimonadaceae bacterium]